MCSVCVDGGVCSVCSVGVDQGVCVDSNVGIIECTVREYM